MSGLGKLDDYDASMDMDPSELMSPVITTDTGIRMAQPRGPIVVTWTMQVCAIICTFLFVGAACIKMQFVLVPLILAYFVTFLMAPILDIMEKRPYQLSGPCGKLPEDREGCSEAEVAYETRLLCEGGFEHDRRVKIMRTIAGRGKYDTPDQTTTQLTLLNFFLMGKIPHVIACAGTLFLSFMIMFSLVYMVYASFTSFGVTELDRTKVCGCGLGKISPQPNPSDGAMKGKIQPCVADKEAVMPCGGTPMSEQLVREANGLVNTLNDMGIKIKKNLYCVPNNEKVSLMQEKDVDGNYVVNVRVYGMYNAESQLGEYIPHGVVSNTSCDEVEVFGTGDGTAYDDLVRYGLGIAGVLNEGAVILLLAIYILLERPEGSTFSLSNRVALIMENMVKNYISLKTALSALTGGLTCAFMLLAGVKLAPIWGLLAFLFNYIPNVGSMIAMVVPIPVIFLDPDLSPAMKTCGFLGPAMVQMYVGNFLEPAVFGKSLNLTAISVLLSLVFFAYLWGISGAVLSVPLLGAFKIVCHDTDHPLAKYFLLLIREDDEIDGEADELLDRWLDRMDDERKRLTRVFSLGELGDSANDWEHTPHNITGHMFGFTPEMHHEYNHAAMTIQKNHRGRDARKKVNELRQERGLPPSPNANKKSPLADDEEAE